MAARSFASVSISFGLVNIPVDVYSAEVSSNRISFNLLHARDGARVKQQYICALDGEVVNPRVPAAAPRRQSVGAPQDGSPHW